MSRSTRPSQAATMSPEAVDSLKQYKLDQPWDDTILHSLEADYEMLMNVQVACERRGYLDAIPAIKSVMKRIREQVEPLRSIEHQHGDHIHRSSVMAAAGIPMWSCIKCGESGNIYPSTTCPQCWKTSYNQNDINQQFCGNCHQFYDTMPDPDGLHD